MRYSTTLICKKGGFKRFTGTVRAKTLEDAIISFAKTIDLSHFDVGYAHTLNRLNPLPEEYRYDIRNSVSGEVQMRRKGS